MIGNYHKLPVKWLKNSHQKNKKILEIGNVAYYIAKSLIINLFSLRNRMQKKKRPETPGEILNEDFLKPLKITQEQLANRLGITRVRLNEVLLGKRSITIDTAIRLSRFFNTTVEFWIGMQAEVDMWDAMNINQKEYEKIIPLKSVIKEDK